MKYDDPLHVLDDLFPEKEAKKEGPKEGPKQKSQLHYTHSPAKGQDGLYLVGRNF